MAKIKTIPERDEYGKGYKQEITLDNGKSYKIQTTPERDPYGDGYVKEIVDTRSEAKSLGLLGILAVFIGMVLIHVVFIGGAFLIFKLMGY